VPWPIKIRAGSQSSHQQGFRFLCDFDRVRRSIAMTPDKMLRHIHTRRCSCGGVHGAPGGLPGDYEPSKNGNSFIFLNNSPIPVITSKKMYQGLISSIPDGFYFRNPFPATSSATSIPTATVKGRNPGIALPPDGSSTISTVVVWFVDIWTGILCVTNPSFDTLSR